MPSAPLAVQASGGGNTACGDLSSPGCGRRRPCCHGGSCEGGSGWKGQLCAGSPHSCGDCWSLDGHLAHNKHHPLAMFPGWQSEPSQPKAASLTILLPTAVLSQRLLYRPVTQLHHVGRSMVVLSSACCNRQVTNILWCLPCRSLKRVFWKALQKLK